MSGSSISFTFSHYLRALHRWDEDAGDRENGCRESCYRHAVSLELANSYVECRVARTDKTDTHYLMNSV